MEKIKMGRPSLPIERFHDYYTPVTESGCWLWDKGINGDGYGYFKWKGKSVRAHRAAWVVYRGTIPDNMMVLHKCDNRSCVNPDHLYLGTSQNNMDDKMARKRFRGNEKINKAVADEIREKYKTGKYTYATLSNEYSINKSMIGNVVRGEAWKR